MADIDTWALAPGFRAAAVACGLKTSSAMGASSLDLALVSADGPCSAAGMFTTNRVKAAPVLYDQDVLARNAGSIRAVITNAGNANACTGTQGNADTQRTAELLAAKLGCQPDQVLVLSTGVIGRPMNMEKLSNGITAITGPEAHHGAPFAARAIMTTDLVPKVASASATIDGLTVTVSGMCKGSGMIHPNMATMLAIITTDALIAPDLLQTQLRAAVNGSFNRISVDGDTSTNDTVLLLASGASGAAVEGETALAAFGAALREVCTSLAKQVVRDGEGATKLIEITVSGAADETQAHMVANSIARSPLVKTAVHGGDPNWGRILCAAGYSGAAIDPNKLVLGFGDASEPLTVVSAGLPTRYEEREAAVIFGRDVVQIRLGLGLGEAETTVWTCDFSKQYVEINAHYTT